MEPSPRRWYDFDGKIVIAALFIIGYYALVFRISSKPLPAENAQLIRDALLVLGPPIGAIINALYRVTGADERQAQLRSADLQTAITTPTGGAAPPAVERAVHDGARAGVADGIGDADGVLDLTEEARPAGTAGAPAEELPDYAR